MIKGGKALMLGGCLAASACAATQSVRVRAIADPATKARFGGGLLADARAQLALGDVGIALETFRALSRQQPENPDAYAGIAACYVAMGRYDIARQNYELALAYAPNDPALLTALATTLERVGEPDQASQVRLEAARLRATAATAVAVAQVSITPLSVPQGSSVTVKLPSPVPVASSSARSSPAPINVKPAVTAAAGEATEPAIARSTPLASKVELTSVPLVPKTTQLDAGSEARIALMEAPQAATTVPREPTPAAVRLSSVPTAPTMAQVAARVALKLSSPSFSPTKADPVADPATPIPAKKGLARAPVPFVRERQPAMVAERRREALVAQVEHQMNNGPYLQRLSSGEVSLVTSIAPARVAYSWPPLPKIALSAPTEAIRSGIPVEPAHRLASVAALRWVPLRYAAAPGNIQLLNAARSQSLAARTRVALLDRGWRKIGIGNARLARTHSLVLYGPARAGLARRLAAHFRCKSLKVQGIRNVVVLLGRDAALSRQASARA